MLSPERVNRPTSLTSWEIPNELAFTVLAENDYLGRHIEKPCVGPSELAQAQVVTIRSKLLKIRTGSTTPRRLAYMRVCLYIGGVSVCGTVV